MNFLGHEESPGRGRHVPRVEPVLSVAMKQAGLAHTYGGNTIEGTSIDKSDTHRIRYPNNVPVLPMTTILASIPCSYLDLEYGSMGG